MNFAWVALAIAGALVAAVGSVWFLVTAARVSVWWLLSCLFLPFVSFAFVVIHWKRASKPFGVSVAGTAVVGLALVLGGASSASRGNVKDAFAAALPRPLKEATRPVKVPEPSVLITTRAQPAEAPQIYTWTDRDGETHYTDDPGTIPARYKKRSKTTEGGNLVIEEPRPKVVKAPVAEESTPKKPSVEFGSSKLLVFRADWCKACRNLEKRGTLDELAGELPALEIQKVDIDDERELAEKYKIRSIPALVVVNDSGQELGRPAAVGTGKTLAAAIERIVMR